MNQQHGGYREGAGRKPLQEGDYRARVLLRQKVDGKAHTASLSTLPEQKEYLGRLGDGNISAGFRKVLDLVDDLHAADAFLEDVGTCVPEKDAEEYRALLAKIFEVVHA